VSIKSITFRLFYVFSLAHNISNIDRNLMVLTCSFSSLVNVFIFQTLFCRTLDNNRNVMMLLINPLERRYDVVDEDSYAAW